MLNVLVFRLNQLLQNIVAPQREALGLSKGQPKVLRYVSEHENCSQNDIAMAYEIKPATVSKLIDGLVENKMLKRIEGKDRRSVKLIVTQRGKDAYKKWNEAMMAVIVMMTKGFDKKEIAIFSDLLERAIDNLKEEIHEGTA